MGGKPDYARRARAVELRLAGYSLSQIAKDLGLKSTGGAIDRWLKGVPAPAWTQRPNAMDDLREQAVKLRLEGYTYKEIRALVPVSKSTLSLWLKDIPLTHEQRDVLNDRRKGANERRTAAIRASHERRRAKVIDEARDQIQSVNDAELFVAGVIAYRAEGSKQKPWDRSAGVAFMNSDHALIKFFLQWLDLIGVNRKTLTFRVSIHESANVERALEFWSDVVGVPSSEFEKTTIKKHKPKTVRKNIGEDYHGCLTVGVRRSTRLNRQIAGWFQGIVDNLL